MTAALLLAILGADANATAHGLGLGLYNWGVGLELPMVGVMGGRGTASNPGLGYSVGGAVVWELGPRVAARLYGRWSETRGGSAEVTFTRAGEQQSSAQAAEWFMAELGLGATYALRRGDRLWAPFFGADLGFSFPKGYQYRFDASLDDLKERDYTTGFEEGGLFGVDAGVVADVRGGLQWQLTPWLLGSAELSAQYAGLSDASISNTLNGPDVRATPETLILVRGTFALLLLL